MEGVRYRARFLLWVVCLDVQRKGCGKLAPLYFCFRCCYRNALDRCSLASMRTSERQRSAAIECVVLLRACFSQSSKSEYPVIEALPCTDHPPLTAPPNRARAKGAQHPQGVRRIRKAAKSPTAAQRYSTQKEARNPDTHKLKTSVRRRHTQNAPDQNPKQKQGLPSSTGVSIPPGENPKRGRGPRFGRPKEWGFPRGQRHVKGPLRGPGASAPSRAFCRQAKPQGELAAGQEKVAWAMAQGQFICPGAF